MKEIRILDKAGVDKEKKRFFFICEDNKHNKVFIYESNTLFTAALMWSEEKKELTSIESSG